MSHNTSLTPPVWRASTSCLARWVLGVAFLYLGLNKALNPVAFLKVLKEYGLFDHPLPLTLIAATLPWIEVFCGLLLVLGVAVRGTALTVLHMLVTFSALILSRGLAMGEIEQVPLCAVQFDCGCGSGKVAVCRKLAENAGLALLASWLLVLSTRTFCMRHGLLRPAS